MFYTYRLFDTYLTVIKYLLHAGITFFALGFIFEKFWIMKLVDKKFDVKLIIL